MVYGDQSESTSSRTPLHHVGWGRFMDRKRFYVVFAVQYLSTLISYVLLVLTDYIPSSLQVFYLLTDPCHNYLHTFPSYLLVLVMVINFN
jgi:hypothetical protein